MEVEEQLKYIREERNALKPDDFCSLMKPLSDLYKDFCPFSLGYFKYIGELPPFSHLWVCRMLNFLLAVWFISIKRFNSDDQEIKIHTLIRIVVFRNEPEKLSL